MADDPGTRIDPPIPGPYYPPVVLIDSQLPEWQDPPSTDPDVGAISRVARSISERTVTVAKRGADIPEIYGRDRVGGLICRAKVYAGKLAVVVVWCGGEIQAIEKVIVGGETFSGGTHYLGTSGQAASALVNTIWGQADALSGIAYSVLQLPKESSLQIEAIIQGRKVYDPRGPSTGYSTNPALALADFIATHTDRTPDWTSFGEAADYCDELISGSVKRWEIGLTLYRGRTEDWIATLKEYANVFLYRDGNVIKAVPNAPRDTDHVLTGADIVKGSLGLRKIGQRDAPTQVITEYTLPTTAEWVDSEEATDDPGDPLRVTRLRMPGFFRAIHARRKAIETLNRTNLEDIEGEFQVFDRGLEMTRGDVAELTHAIGLSSKKLRLHDVQPVQKGIWRIQFREYDPATFSGVVVSDPSTPDTGLRSPNDVPDVTGLTLSVTSPQFQTGIYLTSIKATWSELADYPFARTFEVVFRQNGVPVGSVITTDLEATHGPLREGLTYDVEVTAIGVFGVKSTGSASSSIAVSGKDFPPTDVPNFVAFGIGGEVRFRWGASADNQAIWRYELRYGTSGVAWDDAIFLTRTDSLTHTTADIPVGTWDTLIKAIDNAFNESVNASRTVGVEVDQASDVFLLESLEADRASSVSMTIQADGSWAVDSGETWNALFPSAMSTYTNPVFSYQTPGAAEYVSDALDPGAGELSAAWQANPTVTVLTGSPTSELELYISSVWTGQGSISVFEQAAQSRYKVSGSGSVFIVTPPTTLRVDVVARTEDGNEQTISGGQATSAHAGTQLTDTNAAFQTEGVAIGDIVYNLSDGSKAAITGITSETVLTHDALAGGAGNDWGVSDVYAIGVKIVLSAVYSKYKAITLTPSGVTNETRFRPDDQQVGNPSSFTVIGVDGFNEEVSEPFTWKVEGV